MLVLLTLYKDIKLYFRWIFRDGYIPVIMVCCAWGTPKTYREDKVTMNSNEIKNAVYFLTEQAYCLAQARSKESEFFKLCEEAVRYLVKGDPELLLPFKERTDAVKYDPDADYDTEQYDGKEADMRLAITCLANLAKAPGTPAEKSDILTRTARLIAEFYGAEDMLPETA